MEEKKIAAIREALRRTKSKIQKLHTKLLDKKNCLAAKLLAAFRSAGTVVYQDEQIAKWQKTGFGRSI